ncbi:MAG: OmpA family protein [Vicinamibacteria bacterium]
MRAALCLLTSLLAAGLASAAEPLPAYFKIPTTAKVLADGQNYEAFGQIEIWVTDSAKDLKRGRHWTSALALTGVPEAAEHETLIGPFRTSLKAAGWTTVGDWADSNPASMTMRYQKAGLDSWVYVACFNRDDIRVEIVETGSVAATLVATPPAALPEKFPPTGPFPYVPGIPGAQLAPPSNADSGAFLVTLKGDNEPTMVAASSVSRAYSRPPDVSNLSFVTMYRGALSKAGWDIVEESADLNQSDAFLTAHYAKGERNIWAYLHIGGEIGIKVADVSSSNLAAALKRDCHVALYGVTFDFNKATLRPDSELALAKVAAALRADATVAIEVQGHTDNVGGDAYNLKLSQDRAETVRAWLAAHGVASARLTARGYGRNTPVASNETPEGRAKNRRVEVARPNCH